MSEPFIKLNVINGLLGIALCGCSPMASPAQNGGEARLMSGSPILREAAYFAGSWRIEGGDATCRVRLSAERVESANAHVLTELDGCASRLLGGKVAGWRPATDGIDMAGPDRLSVGFFSFQGDGSATLSRGGRTYRLMRG